MPDRPYLPKTAAPGRRTEKPVRLTANQESKGSSTKIAISRSVFFWYSL
ncbi:hypothetical protein FHX48_002638 [Microbacterium halimionae]|uniref:Uncharacterized protein n=1 Tax=Microbacterium halimionae TaxID=1526413 RepID=A0A7W3JRG4_9MICO|nr:hypothetical protein [Microbacterium halimionae]NII95024.1 hypothetical protein [Microbacterium halimionae]